MTTRHARIVALLAATLAGSALFFESSTLGGVKRAYLDALVRSRDPRALDGPNDPLVLVAIDQRSDSAGLENRRTELARAIETIAEAGPRVIAIDLQFDRPDPASESARDVLDALTARIPEAPSWIKQEIALLRRERDGDARLVAILSRAPTVGTFYSGSGDVAPPVEALGREIDAVACDDLGTTRGAFHDRAEYVAAFSDRGDVRVLFDEDRVVRRYPLVTRMGDAVRPSFALAAASRWIGEDAMMECAGASVVAMSLGTSADIAFDPRGATVVIDYRGSLEQSFPRRISLTEVASIPAERFRDKLVFIGYENPFLDILVTPQGRMNGIAIHGIVASSLLQRHWMRRPWGMQHAEALLALALTALSVTIALTSRSQRLWVALPIAIALPLVAHLTGMWLVERDRLVDLLSPALFGSLGLLATGVVRWHDERTRRLETEAELGAFFSPEVLRVALANPSLLAPRRRELTLLFSDIRGFTRAAESLDPETLISMLSLYFERMTQVVLENGGQVDKYIGDAVMAYFGAPEENARHAHLACRAAIAMRDEAARMQEEWGARGLPRLGVGIGVNTGMALVGKIGSARKKEYTSIGDDVNFASRAEGLTKAYGAGIIVGQTTAERVRDEFVLRDLGPVKVEGKTRSIRIHELLHPRAAGSEPAWLAEFHRGLAAFLARDWRAARAAFRGVIEMRGADGPSQSFLEEIDRLEREPPPADWDGSLVRHK